MIIISKFGSSFTNFYVITYLLTKLIKPVILFSTAVHAEVVAKPLILGILFSISVNLVL